MFHYWLFNWYFCVTDYERLITDTERQDGIKMVTVRDGDGTDRYTLVTHLYTYPVITPRHHHQNNTSFIYLYSNISI